ncbi:MAG: OmpH family outer membrane protein [Candidatus Krumholzibacteria bacterium]|nr:OmpH family outer membrane protein [Candidatus Krumholzibacteria bacterium]MDH4337961.1 OmpH family outer membrane protein [Candidatus Krumholzibacteria bacterium]MDH5271215.1 OmpH family outer membrane protein [Candidatus Krumholzibacteria bacterium]
MVKKLVAGALMAVAVLAGGAISALAQDVKIGYIDSIKIFAENKETQEAERLYRRDVEQWEAQKQRMEQELMRMGEELNAQSAMLSEEKKAERRLEVQRKSDEYKRFMEETFGDNGLAARRNKELTQPIVDKINRVIERIAEEQGYSMVFDVANANIVFAAKTLDITELVLTALSSQQ